MEDVDEEEEEVHGVCRLVAVFLDLDLVRTQ